MFSTSDIDGGLVGGASLKPEEFSKIVNYDAIRAVKLIADVMANAVIEGRQGEDAEVSSEMEEIVASEEATDIEEVVASEEKVEE